MTLKFIYFPAISYRFPPVHKYQFAEPNSGQNIVFEDKEKGGGVPDMIKVNQNKVEINQRNMCT